MAAASRIELNCCLVEGLKAFVNEVMAINNVEDVAEQLRELIRNCDLWVNYYFNNIGKVRHCLIWINALARALDGIDLLEKSSSTVRW